MESGDLKDLLDPGVSGDLSTACEVKISCKGKTSGKTNLIQHRKQIYPAEQAQ